MIRGKSVLVTGSTSGIGLAVARAFAAEGANITLNGFGDSEAVEQQRRSIEETFAVSAAYSGADVTKPIEIADHGITCNAICPGWVMTPPVAAQIAARANAAGQSFDEAKQEFVAEKQPMARYTSPEDIGALAVFRAGDAAANITGASYSIDGGWTAQ